jgi:Rrf2 family protein
MNQTERYRLEALIELALSYPQGRSTSEIARRREIPPAYLSRLLAELARAGWVHSRRGPGGGVTLASSPEKIALSRVMAGRPRGTDLPPALGRLASTIDDAVRRTMATISVADLARWGQRAATTDYSI